MESRVGLKKSRGGWFILAVSLAGLAILLILFLFRKKKQSAATIVGKLINVTGTAKGNVSEVLKPIAFYNIVLLVFPYAEQAKLVTAIAMHETGLFKSQVLYGQNNAFGIKTSPAMGGYATYKSVEDSIKAFIRWFELKRRPVESFTSVTEIVEFMKANNYFEADKELYRKAVQAHYNNLQKQF